MEIPRCIIKHRVTMIGSHFPKAVAASSSDEYFGLFVDSFDQKWITLENAATAGNGLVVLDTGSDPESASDDNSVKLTTGESNKSPR